MKNSTYYLIDLQCQGAFNEDLLCYWGCLKCYCSYSVKKVRKNHIIYNKKECLSLYFLHCFTYHGGYSMKSVCNCETCKCKAVGLHAFITCAYVNWILVNVGWSGSQLVLEPFCSISRTAAGHIWCQYIPIAYCNSPFPGLNMLAQRPILKKKKLIKQFQCNPLEWSQIAITGSGRVLQETKKWPLGTIIYKKTVKLRLSYLL